MKPTTTVILCSGLPHTPQYYELKKKRMALPISQYQAKIMELLERDDIPAMVIVGETGCGKSTQVSHIQYFEILK